MGMSSPVYLIDLEGYRPGEECRANQRGLLNVWKDTKKFSEDFIRWNEVILEKSGLDFDGTFLPPNLNMLGGQEVKQDLNYAAAECKQCVTGAIDSLLARLNLSPSDIDILVTTCSIYCPTPSMASMVVNHYKMRTNIQSYHLGGMGCSNGVVALALIRDLLRARPNVNALFITTEVTTPAYYPGMDRTRAVTNMLFRMGAAAMLFSNKSSWGSHIKYELVHHERIHAGGTDDAYSAIMYGPDDEGINGVYLGKNVTSEASKALTKVMTKVAPRIMTWRQIGEYVAYQLNNWKGKDKTPKEMGKDQGAGPRTPSYVPNFMECTQHVLIHAGGAKVLDGIGKALSLNEHYLTPSRRVLRDYGNVSSSSTWYTLAWVESCRGVKKGDKIMQVGVGSGMKCGVAVWKAKKDIRDVHNIWEHAVPEEERRAIQMANKITGEFGRERALYRLFYLLLMIVVMGVVHGTMMASGPGVWGKKLEGTC